MPSEHPILFTSENVRAILQGRKTQTRRIVKLTDSGRIKKPGSPKNWHPDDANAVQACPYGMPGDRLWVRETWRVVGGREYEYQQRIEDVRYRANLEDVLESGNARWRPSIFMPRWACRIVLELIAVRVERLQEISEADAQAEGAAFVCELCGCDLDTDHGAAVHFACDDPDCERASHREGFRRLWESINGAGSWALNPWVWVLEFREVKNG